MEESDSGMRSDREGLVWVFELPAHIVSRVFGHLTTRELLQSTSINKRWNTLSPTYWTEVQLLHRTPDNIKAKIIARSSASLKTIKFKFYFDYLLAFKALQLCPRLKHLTIGEGGLTWIAGANASTANANANPSLPETNGSKEVPKPTEDADAKLLVAKATDAANQAADAANDANNAANAAAHHVATAEGQIALLINLPSSVLASFQAALQAAKTASNAAATAANAAANAASAGSIAAGMASQLVRYHETTYLHQSPLSSSNGTPSAAASASTSTSTSTPSSNQPQPDGPSRSPRSATVGDSFFSAKQIKTLCITSGRSSKKVIPEYKHLHLFSNLRELSLDGSISPPFLLSLILSARSLRSLRVNCSDSGNELQALRHAASLQVLQLHYFSHLFIGYVCAVPSLTDVRLQYTNQSPQLGLQQIASALPNLRCVHLTHPTFTITPPATVHESELNYLCALKNLVDLDLRLPKCEPDTIGALNITSLRKLGTSMVLPVSFVQKQPKLSHISLFSNHLSLTTNASTSLIPPELPTLIPQVHSLRLEGINLTKQLAKVLSELNLRTLKILCEEVNREELELLLTSKTLEFLDIFVTISGDVNNKTIHSIPKANANVVVNIS